jgi:hypothetical protein
MNPKIFKRYCQIRKAEREQAQLDDLVITAIHNIPFPPPIEAFIIKKYYQNGRTYPVQMLQDYRRH